MKKLAMLVLCLGLVSATPIVFTTGCNATQERITYNTLGTMGHSVDTAYKAYLDLVVQGKVKTNTVPTVSNRYTEFQTAFKFAIMVAQGNTNAVPTAGLSESAAYVTTAIAEARK